IQPELLASLEAPGTHTVATPSGGRHFYFDSEWEVGNAPLAQYVDVRSANGYVLAPPSIVNGKAYRVITQSGRLGPLPGWAMDRRRGYEPRGSTNLAPFRQGPAISIGPRPHLGEFFCRSSRRQS